MHTIIVISLGAILMDCNTSTITEVYSKFFIKGFKKVTKGKRSFPSCFDILKNDIKVGSITNRVVHVGDLPSGCNGYKVMKKRKMNCEKTDCEGIRIIFVEYRNYLIFLQCYNKDDNEKDMNKKQICKDLSYFNTEQQGMFFVVLDEPKSRALLQGKRDD